MDFGNISKTINRGLPWLAVGLALGMGLGLVVAWNTYIFIVLIGILNLVLTVFLLMKYRVPMDQSIERVIPNWLKKPENPTRKYKTCPDCGGRTKHYKNCPRGKAEKLAENPSNV